MTDQDPLAPATHEELLRLETFLQKKPITNTAMTVSMIDGMLTAAVIGPTPVMPSDFLPWIWDLKKGQRAAAFASDAETHDIIGIIVGMQNRIAEGLVQDPPRYQPLFAMDDRWTHVDWAQGFETGTCFDLEAWDELFEANAGDEEPVDFPSLEPLDVMTNAEARDHIGDQWPLMLEDLEAMVVDLRDWFRDWTPAPQTPFVRSGPKVGRNDACPCGSGKKFKKCCGDGTATVH
ncbi:MAG: UPF0149 family protein [Vicinamibacteria bacterium]